LSEVDHLLGLIYEGPLEDPPWGDFLDALRVDIEALTVALVLRSPSQPHLGMLVIRGFHRFESNYNDHFFAMDPFVHLEEGVVTTLAQVVPTEELIQTSFYRGLLEPAGVLHIAGVDLRAEGDLEGRLRLCRSPDQDAFDDEDCRRLGNCVDHLRRALRIYEHLSQAESERDVYAHAVEDLAVGALLLDGAGEVVQMNGVAERLFARKLGIGLREGKLIGATAGETSLLRDAIGRALEQRAAMGPALAEALRLSPADGTGGSLGILIRPIPLGQETEGRASPALAVFVSDPEAEAAVPLDVVRKLFNLTRAEASLAVRLASGLSLDEAAADLGIARNTVRAQLRAVFEKTGATRQAELVRLILRSVASLGGATF
jgi:DNA-binding CsgD family transcriptional regulator/PAS domain-containing protein